MNADERRSKKSKSLHRTEVRWRQRGQALRRCSGQAYTEFIVVLPFVLFLTFLAWEMAYFWWARTVTTTATFEAARHVATHGGSALTGENLGAMRDGREMYKDVMSIMGPMGDKHMQGFALYIDPVNRSVRATASTPYRWSVMSQFFDLSLRSSAFFRLEEFHPGAPETWE